MRILVLDVMNLAYRAYFGMSNSSYLKRSSDGHPTFMSFVFSRYLRELATTWKPNYIVAAVDSKGRTVRHEMWPEYKATRSQTPDDIKIQIDDVLELLTALGVKQIRIDKTEADDIIAAVVKQTPGTHEVLVASSDKDVGQVLCSRVGWLRPDGKGFQYFNVEKFIEKYQIKPEQMVDYLSIVGDTSDNIPGIKGLGEKAAVKLLTQFGSLDGIYANLDQITGATKEKLSVQKDMAYLSQKLIRLNSDLEINLNLDSASFSMDNFHSEPAQTFFKKQEFRTFIK